MPVQPTGDGCGFSGSLSRRERAGVRAHRHRNRCQLDNRRNTKNWLPLPSGEGWGEGQAPPRAFSNLKHFMDTRCLYTSILASSHLARGLVAFERNRLCFWCGERIFLFAIVRHDGVSLVKPPLTPALSPAGEGASNPRRQRLCAGDGRRGVCFDSSGGVAGIGPSPQPLPGARESQWSAVLRVRQAITSGSPVRCRDARGCSGR